jgi:hypothetical protein
MKQKAGCLFTVFLFISCVNISSTRASWDWVQNVGGIKLETPILENGSYYLPIKCNATGMEEITVKSKIINSAPLYFIKSKVLIENNEINFYLIYALTLKDKYQNNLQSIKLGNIKQGKYKVNYIDQDKTKQYIREIEIN